MYVRSSQNLEAKKLKKMVLTRVWNLNSLIVSCHLRHGKWVSFGSYGRLGYGKILLITYCHSKFFFMHNLIHTIPDHCGGVLVPSLSLCQELCYAVHTWRCLLGTSCIPPEHDEWIIQVDLWYSFWQVGIQGGFCYEYQKVTAMPSNAPIFQISQLDGPLLPNIEQCRSGLCVCMSCSPWRQWGRGKGLLRRRLCCHFRDHTRWNS